MIADVEHHDALVDVFEKPTNLILHPRTAEAAANAQADAVLPHDRAHRAEHRRLFAPKFDVVRLILPIIAAIGFPHCIDYSAALVLHADLFWPS